MNTTNKFDFTDVVTTPPTRDYSKNDDGTDKVRYIKLGKDKPKVRTVTVTEVLNGATKFGEPFIRFTVKDAEGYIAQNEFFINTEVKPGKQTSAFNVAKTDFVKFLVATGTKTEEDAKAYLQTATSEVDLATKLSTCVGKPFKMGFWGKVTTSSKGKFLKTMFAQGTNNIMPIATPDDKVNTNSKKDESSTFVSDYEANNGTTTTKVATTTTSDLPF